MPCVFPVKCQAQTLFWVRAGRFVLFAMLVLAGGVCSAAAAVTQAEFDSGVNGTMSRLTKEGVTLEGSALVSEMLQREYGAPAGEIQWALERQLPWGTIAAFAYVRATTGQSFEELERSALAKDWWGYLGKTGMSADKMIHSLDQFLKVVEAERNTRIFERMRANRRVLRMPDLGSGFGLLQEALDFRRLETARPTKVHTLGSGDLLKGEQ
jgi:hypothetical protein